MRETQKANYNFYLFNDVEHPKFDLKQFLKSRFRT